MSMRRQIGTRGTRLIGVPHFHQGDGDSLCYLYAMSMVLGALRPRLLPRLMEPPRRGQTGSPVFKALRKIAGAEDGYRERLESWVFKGIKNKEALDLMNRVLQQLDGAGEAYFVKRTVCTRRAPSSSSVAATTRKWTIKHAFHYLDAHLPLLVCGGGIGSHAVVAIGYSIETSGRWVQILDPGRSGAEWEDASSVFSGGASVILPRNSMFNEYRPTKLIVQGTGADVVPWDSEVESLV